MNTSQKIMIRAGAVRDALGVLAQPGVVVVHEGRILAAGGIELIDPALLSDIAPENILDYPDSLLLPALVNAHVHLGLTPLGQQPYQGDFVSWVRGLRESLSQYQFAVGDPVTALRQAVAQGAAMSRESGVGFVGDIASDPAALGPVEQAGLSGVSYLELFGITGASLQQGMDMIAQRARAVEFSIRPDSPSPLSQVGVVKAGLQPHAPYSAGMDLYQAAAKFGDQLDLPLCTHLAENTEELEFVARAAGPMAQWLVEIGKWENGISRHYGKNQHPIDWLEPVLDKMSSFRSGRKFAGQFRNRWLLAHCNYAGDDQIEILARTGVSVAYCPIASDYFGHPRAGKNLSPAPGKTFVKHRYQDMLEAMVNVCLGTDSILCQRPGDSQPMGIFGQMRYLFARDQTAPGMLLAMATVNGLRAMGFDEKLATLSAGVPANLIAVKFDPANVTDPLTQALMRSEPVRRVFPV